jgi:hypothetical protein
MTATSVGVGVGGGVVEYKSFSQAMLHSGFIPWQSSGFGIGFDITVLDVRILWPGG